MILIVMGVSGTGKSTLAKSLSDTLSIPYLEADDFHPQSNIDKMSSGTPLTEDDRLPWLQILAAKLATCDKLDQSVILACSALTQNARALLSGNCRSVHFIHLKGDKSLILDRMNNRNDHFMPASLLDSQFQTLEEPELAITVSIDQPISDMVDEVTRQL